MLENTFKDALLNATPEFQDEFGYDKDEPGKANLTVAFKDNADVPDDIYGWSVQRSRQLGEDLLIGVNAVVKKLKASEQ